MKKYTLEELEEFNNKIELYKKDTYLRILIEEFKENYNYLMNSELTREEYEIIRHILEDIKEEIDSLIANDSYEKRLSY